MNEKLAIEIMLENTSIIKRPIIERNKKIIVGFDEITYASFIK
jgi:arsenate reductase-like glutaredoxin family protein